ncbi:MAG: VWA domain-containing protein [Myxococcales bacterium]|nr:VWA domain-containing protein [Myxococcales bacterium]MCB9715920.1 VWA domain-containing protein [Myxococcales bacterium]
MRNHFIPLCLALVPTLAACNAHPLKSVELQTSQEDDDTVPLSVNRDVDILFVIDNSRSMAQEQATLARNFGPLVERLTEVDANYRIAIITTDAGHMQCPSNDAGNFKLRSCRSRPEDFETLQGDDYFEEACASVCDHDDIEVLPTATFQDPTPRARPWIESIDGVTNLPEGVDPVEAFQCFGPQGVTGCGFESPLEAMRLGLLQAGDDRSEEFGFMRPGAILAVVFVTDEADCSSRWAQVSDPWDVVNGSRALWSPENADRGRLTSEVCWFAGVECEQSPDGTQECWAVDKAADGSEADSEDEAVLHPLSRYAELLSQLEEQKKAINPDQELLVAVLTGVPTSYDGGRIPYTQGNDPEFLLDNGIGAGCESANGKAAPPVRLAELAHEFRGDEDEVNLYSVCKEDYSDAMSSIAEAIGKQVRPPCVKTCVADVDPVSAGLQPECQLTEEYVALDGEVVRYSIPECLPSADGFTLPEGVDACYRPLTDRDGSTPGVEDDMSETCVDEGWNLELAIERREGVAAPAGAQVQARCSVSPLKSVDCPDLLG